MEHRFNPGDRVVFIGEPGRYKINFPGFPKTDITGIHGEILNVEASEALIPGYDLPFYNVKFDDILSKVFVCETLLSFEWEYEYPDDATIDQGNINLFLGI